MVYGYSVCDVYNQRDPLKAAANSVYGKKLQIDSTKKVTKKLQNVKADSAKWVTNVGNERDEYFSVGERSCRCSIVLREGHYGCLGLQCI